MLVLFETAAGYAVFKLLDEKKLHKTENLYKDFENPESASQLNFMLKMKHFKKFQDTTEALAVKGKHIVKTWIFGIGHIKAATAAVEGKMSKPLKKLLKKLVVKEAQEELAVSDAKLGNVIKDKFNISCVSNSNIQELMRGIRSQMNSLITGLPEKEMAAMSLSRYKLKFSPDKVDTMIVQAIYNLAYCKVVKTMGYRTNASTTDFSEILPEEIEQELKDAAEISMGTEISEEDIINIKYLCDQVIEISEYRAQLYEYVKNRMMAVAPNLTILVGELVGARLIAHAGSLLNLAKHPSSTVQILGAEKALFRALKTKHDTPKYGLIYHASLVGQTNTKFKGKMSRMLAAKSSLAIRVDALGEDTNAELGLEHKAKLEKALRHLEDKNIMVLLIPLTFESYFFSSEVKTYDNSMDSTLPRVPKKRKFDEDEEEDVKPEKLPKIEPETNGKCNIII
ncbi:hypothetical protein KUTeg_001990 [Tegillarca granosa]|uniref:Nop domain-containing protein n=1 Tax=Tegillarca granosa TaxID=220873 RepID=A0ABQ9FT24_TEGGR|nr:hypothetical protein KUTeg_001990 [Tegillarca granosa]